MNETTIIRNLYTALNAAFNKAFGAAAPQWQKIATEVPSSASATDYGWLGDWPSIEEWVGERQLAELKEHGYSITNKTWESSIKVRREKVEDDQLGMYSIQAQQIGYDAAMHPDSLIFPLLMKGFTELCYDGQYFFDEDHPMGDSTHSNVQLETQAAPVATDFQAKAEAEPTEVSDVLTITLSESELDRDVTEDVATDEGWTITVGAKIADVVSYNNDTMALVVTGGTLVAGDVAADTAIVIKGFVTLPTTVREPWFILDNTKPLRGLIFQPRRPFKFTQLNDPNQTFVFMNNEYAMGVDGRSNAGYGLWQFAFASQLELTADNFKAARAQMRKVTKTNGTPLGVRPTTIVVGSENQSAAEELFDAMTGPNGSSNTLYKAVEIIVSEYIVKPGA